MEDKELLRQKSNLNADYKYEEENDEDNRMKIFGWSPDWLQSFNSIRWFLFVFCLASLTQGIIVSGLSVVSLPTIEKEFGISSKSAGLILAGNDASALLLVGIVSFFGTKAHKPRWIATGILLTGIGGFLFALPKLMVDTYIPLKLAGTGVDMCNPRKTMMTRECAQDGSMGYVAILFIAQFIMGAGVAPLYTLGPAYLDENVSPKSSPVYLGIWFASTMLGPGLGFLLGGQFLQVFTNIDAPEGMLPTDPRWIGAWWLGFVTLSALFFVCGFILLMFPKEIPECQEMRRRAIENGAIPKEDESIEFSIKGYILSSIKICLNKIFMLGVLAMTVKTMYALGLAAFIVKILVVKFGVSPYEGGTMMGIIMVPSMLIGILGGAFIMNKINVNVAAKSAAKICFVMSLLTMPTALIYLLPGCSNTNIAGKMVPYDNQTNNGDLSLYNKCNKKCLCSEESYVPICGSNDITYQSPCFAGCTAILVGKDKLPYFGNCSCIPNMSPEDRIKMADRSSSIKINVNALEVMSKKMNISDESKVLHVMNMMRQTLYNQATLGPCDRGCKNFLVFAIIIMVMVIISFISGTPHKMLILRSVPDNQRSFALGVQFLIMRSLSFLPAPIIMGAVVDSQCLTWTYDKCGVKKNCVDYDIDNLSTNLVLFAMCTSAIAAVFYGLAVFLFSRQEDNYEIEEKEELKPMGGANNEKV